MHNYSCIHCWPYLLQFFLGPTCCEASSMLFIKINEKPTCHTHYHSRRAVSHPLSVLHTAMSGYWNRYSWWSKGWESNAQEGGGRTWEVSVAEDNKSAYQRDEDSATHSWDPVPTPASQTPESSGPERTHSVIPSEEEEPEPSSKRPKIEITIATLMRSTEQATWSVTT